MEFLRDLFGNFTSGIIRLAVAVGIIAAAYFFIVRPVLDTTEHVSDSVNNSISQSFEQSFGPHSQASKALRQANRQVQIQIRHSVHQARHQGGADRAMKLVHCIQHVAPDVDKMQRCSERFSP